MKTRKVLNERFKILMKNPPTRILHPGKLFFKNEGKIKIFSDKQGEGI
jgi:hypothetical protein